MSQSSNAGSSKAFRLPPDVIDDWMGQPVPRAGRLIAPVIKIEEPRKPPRGKNWKVPMGPNHKRR